MLIRKRSVWLLAMAAAGMVSVHAHATENTVAVTKAATAKAKSDPLYRYQWHLSNQGQKVFADTRPVPGVDLDIGTLHDAKVRGTGVIVAVVDDGLEIRHPDLLDNVVIGGSKNFVDGSNDPTPTNPNSEHGTSVAGIIAEVGWNGVGGRGVAPEAKLKGFNFLSSDADGIETDQDTNIRYSWGNGPEARDAQVFNNSWGISTSSFPAVNVAETKSWEKLMSSTRNGKGGVYLKAAGNNFSALIVSFLGFRFNLCAADSLTINVGCSLANTDPTNNYITTTVVAAVNADGIRSSYSSPGSAVWVSGIGGEYGFQKKYYPDLTNIGDWAKATFYQPAIVTTDLTGCAAGSNADRANGEVDNALDTSQSTIDKTCNYWAGMNGTSAATPTVAGVTALVLGVNPKLSARDVKYILATTARQIDPLQPKAVYKGAVQDPGWITNAAGHHFSNWYGFGLADASAAVEKARNFKSLPALQDSGWLATADKPVAIEGIGSQNSKLTVAVTKRMKVEAVQFGFTTTHKTPRNLRAILTSPSGTKSYVLPAFTTLSATSGGFAVDLSSSNAFLDEPALGTWTLQLLDMNDSSGSAQLQAFNLRVVGH
ncbi:MAG: Microbial serine proteinase [Luteibacter sp.]|uniref:S8 family serine peptidase n=1 Tax=Luteibacter sp. TaxID=1886636 RepID=UPI00137FB1A6|nr:S8 family serine peptidase [Luteibacter sp.]KAF1004457.1 MAG: Microbial serine proteinase [Luteibacter sp.]